MARDPSFRRIARGTYRFLTYVDWYARAWRFARRSRCAAVHAHDLNVLPAATWNLSLNRRCA